MSTPANSPLVSVVIPVYNMAEYVTETLASVSRSTYPSLEVIVVDDGSTDNSAAVVEAYAATDARVRLLRQPNGGVCRARNAAIAVAGGEYVLPVDADNLIEPDFIAKAVAAIVADPSLKVVAPRADFFGERTGEWVLPPFSLSLLARKNIMDTCALYRRADWQRAGGYCEELQAREDWEFWIAILKDGGGVLRLPDIGLHYRVRAASKRIKDRSFKRQIVSVLNRRHPEFFERELGGPLREHRSWSRLANRLSRLLHPHRMVLVPECGGLRYFVRSLPRSFRYGRGRLIHDGRNQLREITFGGRTYVVKSFRTPHFINRLVYGLFRPSKARRSFDYARLLHNIGIGSPAPVGWLTVRHGLLFTESYYVSEQSVCPHTYADLIGGTFPGWEPVCRAIARITAQLHEQGIIHRDYSRGNILFRLEADGSVRVELVDLNRLRFHPVSPEEGCRNFAERLPATLPMRRLMAEEYARVRQLDPEECLRQMQEGAREDE